MTKTTKLMMALGQYRFSIDSASYHKLSRSSSYKWGEQARIGGNPALQFVGLGKETVSLSGVIYPHFKGGLEQVDKMRSEAAAGKPLLMTDSLGSVHGFWCVESIEEIKGQFAAGGIPRKIEFSLNLAYYGKSYRG